MPAYNAEATIARAVETTLAALPRDAELCVADDASQDGTLAVLEELAGRDRRVVVYPAAGNAGVAVTLNRLLAVSGSEYIARMDADDAVLPWRFHAGVGLLAAGRADAVFATVVNTGPGRRIVPAVPLPISPEAMPLALLLRNPVAHSTLVARRDVVEAAGGYPLVPSEDYDLWLGLAGRGHALRRLAAPATLYRRHPNQDTADARWVHQAARNPEPAAAHSELSVRQLGRDFGVYELLRRRVRDAAEAGALRGFLQRVGEEAARLRGTDRVLVRRFCAAVEKTRLG
ncbi:glycosyltransferase family 2 protein [Arthrobacter deserti]|uniref:Glycosyltransferase family 2 protein n=1 Tax=Arthrobacter deserti TaxID=1742687 RepID=A0ABX1JNF0_9MICC|nr:glycosyltransferase family 2 protein [Arthrobacter deserti]